MERKLLELRNLCAGGKIFGLLPALAVLRTTSMFRTKHMHFSCALRTPTAFFAPLMTHVRRVCRVCSVYLLARIFMPPALALFRTCQSQAFQWTCRSTLHVRSWH